VPQVTQAALYSEATLFGADFLVACAIELWMARRAPRTRTTARRLGLRLVLQGVRCTVNLGVAALGALAAAPPAPAIPADLEPPRAPCNKGKPPLLTP
jgi:hypothetical protein